MPYVPYEQAAIDRYIGKEISINKYINQMKIENDYFNLPRKEDNPFELYKKRKLIDPDDDKHYSPSAQFKDPAIGYF